MVGLVIVSHSRSLGEALLALVAQVCPTPIPVRVAAGTGPDHAEIGTDAVAIVEAIKEVHSPDGVVVLMDLGSAILSAETALDLLPEGRKESVRLCPAPLVEGALSAAVQIGSGGDLDSVCREACRALQPKQEQAGSAGILPALPEGELLFTLTKPHGLHARPAARLVQLITGLRADVRFRRPHFPDRGVVSARSLTSLFTLGARQGELIAVSASGEEAGKALDAVRDFLKSELAEEVSAQPPDAQVKETGRPARAVPLSPGVAWGPVYVYNPSIQPAPESASDPDAEWTRFGKALEAAKETLRARLRGLASSASTEAEILQTLLLTLEDPEIISRVQETILTSRKSGEWAWRSVIDGVIATYEGLDDPYLRQRAADLRDIRAIVHHSLAPESPGQRQFADVSQPVIVIARESSPGLIASFPRDLLLGMITVEGQETSHGAILARSLRIPAVSGIPSSFLSFEPETIIGIDGTTGEMWVNPDAEELRELTRRKGESPPRAEIRPPGPCRTKDGVRLKIAANVGSVEGARVAALEQAEAIGVLRTEFMYLNRVEPPPEQEQITTLEEIAAAMGGRPVYVRTLDVGGDKPAAFLPRLSEQNPYLGVRGIRLSFRVPSVFRTQVRAVLRAGVQNDLRLMLPMVASVEDLLQARAFIEKWHLELVGEKLAHRWPVQLALMIETPSAALTASSLAPLVDFLSIGTNDLTQYTLAAERGHPQLGPYLDSLHPSVLQLIAKTVEAAHLAGKPVGVCGEIASDPVATPILIGLQVDEISIEPAAIARICRVAAGLSAKSAREWVPGVLKLATAKEVREAAAAYCRAYEPQRHREHREKR